MKLAVVDSAVVVLAVGVVVIEVVADPVHLKKDPVDPALLFEFDSVPVTGVRYCY